MRPRRPGPDAGPRLPRRFAAASVLPSLVLALAVAACAPEGSGLSDGGLDVRRLVSGLRAVPPPAGEGAAAPHLEVGEDGTMYLSWLEPAGLDRHALRFSRLSPGDASWSNPRTVVRGGDVFVNWADVPSLVPVGGGRLAAHWLVSTGPDPYAYEVRVAFSEDGGRSWSPPLTPHRDGTLTEHGFVSLFSLPSGGPAAGDGDGSAVGSRPAIGAAWLDGRAFADEDAAGDMALRFAALSPRPEEHDGAGAGRGAEAPWRVGAEAVLDGRVCECCQTDVARTKSGPVVVYRDRSRLEIRDVHAVRWSGAGWTEPAPVHDDGWRIEGCPVNGPAAAGRGQRVAVAWFTAADDRPRARLAFSADGGRAFSEPVRVDDGRPLGRVDVELLEDGSALVSWLEADDGGAELRLRRVRRERRGASAAVAATSAGRSAGFPRLAVGGGRVVLAWTDPGPPSRIRAAVARRKAR